MFLTLLNSSAQSPTTPQQIYQEIWVIDKREKGEPRKNRRVVKKIKRQLQEAIQAVEAVKEVQKRQESFAQQKQAIDLAQQQIELSFELLALETQKLELQKAAEAFQAKVRLEEYIRQEYEKAVILYQEGLRKKEQEELEDLQMLLDYLMAEA